MCKNGKHIVIMNSCQQWAMHHCFCIMYQVMVKPAQLFFYNECSISQFVIPFAIIQVQGQGHLIAAISATSTENEKKDLNCASREKIN